MGWHSNNAAMQVDTMEPERRVLVCDDDDAMLSLMERSLRRNGFSVEVAHDGEGLCEQLAHNGPFGLVISDVNMPGLSGVEVLRRMREQGLSTPVILVTAYPHAPLEARASELGAATILSKPFPIAHLAERALHVWQDASDEA